MSRVLIVEDHAVVRAGLCRLLQSLPDIATSEAPTGEAALALLANGRFDLIILDLNLPGLGGFELLRRLRQGDGSSRVLVLSMHSEPVYAARCLDNGAIGYVSKNAAPCELERAVVAALSGKAYVEAEIAEELQKYRSARREFQRPLSCRELEVLHGLAAGHGLSEIAARLGIAYKTVANTCTHAKEKLGAESLADLIRMAVKGELG